MVWTRKVIMITSSRTVPELFHKVCFFSHRELKNYKTDFYQSSYFYFFDISCYLRDQIVKLGIMKCLLDASQIKKLSIFKFKHALYVQVKVYI